MALNNQYIIQYSVSQFIIDFFKACIEQKGISTGQMNPINILSKAATALHRITAFTGTAESGAKLIRQSVITLCFIYISGLIKYYNLYRS